LADYYYFTLGDVSAAIENYGKAKSEAPNSTYQVESSAKYDALQQIKLKKNIQSFEDPQLYVDAKLESAENYMTVLSKPDSANAVFEQIKLQPQVIQVKIDSLKTDVANFQASLDSLVVEIDSTDIKASEDTLETAPKTNNPKLRQLEERIKSIQDNVSRQESNRQMFIDEYIPYSLFVKASLIARTEPDSTLLNQIYTDMLESYPENKYTNALKLLIEGKSVSFTDSRLETEKAELDNALLILPIMPDSALIVLGKLSDSGYAEIRDIALFRLGWHYTFEQQDTTKAKTYYDILLDKDKTSDISRLILRYYNGVKFTINFDPDTLSSVYSVLADSLDLKATGDTLKTELPLYKVQDNTNTPEPELEPSEPESQSTSPELIKQESPTIIKPD
jgi:tetratricopeptide (TPR) repeat protein